MYRISINKRIIESARECELNINKIQRINNKISGRKEEIKYKVLKKVK